MNFFRAQAEQRKEAGDSTGIIYAIEEPETSQHFDNQKLLIDAFKELSLNGNAQIILTTHSGTVVKQLAYSNIRLIQDNNGKKEVVAIEKSLLPYPSLNEVNYVAYGEASEGYHDELYGHLESHGLLDDYKKPRDVVPYYRDGKLDKHPHDLTHYIRDQIHHPENKENPRFTPSELKQSIDDMRAYIKGHPVE